jgi:hypothetical protein
MRDLCLGALATVISLAACAHRPLGTTSTISTTTPQAAPFSLMTLPSDIHIGIGISEKAAQADALWDQRLDPKALAEATDNWKDLLASNPGDHRARASLMRAYLFAAEGPLAMASRQQSIQATLQSALLLAEEALATSCQPLQQRMREGLPSLMGLPAWCGATCPLWMFWYAVALTDFAMTSDVTVLLAWQGPIVALWQDLIARGDVTGYAHAYLGAFYAHAPKFAGGNLPLAKQHLEQAMRQQKDELRTQVWYAEYVLAPLHMRDALQSMLRQVVAADASKIATRLPEQQLAQLRARQLLERLDDLL